MNTPLSDIRVLDLSRVLAGPFAGQMLGDLGAEVIKIERPKGGDDTRKWGPPFLEDDEGNVTSESAYFLTANRNKKSVSVDLASEEGQVLIRELVKKSDVLLENYKVGGLKKYGLDYESLKKINPRLVYCSITGFGQSGPYATRGGYDFLMQGLGGLMSVTGHSDTEPGGGPMKVGVALTDVMTGLYAVIAVLSALRWRDSSGEGQHIDLALMDVQVAGLANQAMNYLTTGKVPTRRGNAHPSIVPYQDFPTADGFMILAVGNDAQFARLSAAVGRPEWAQDERFKFNDTRVANRDELIGQLNQITAAFPTSYWIDLLESVDVPCGPINDLAGVFSDPQVIARGMKIDMPHSLCKTVPLVQNPIRFSATPIQHRYSPPLLGEHTREVLTDLLGLDAEQLDALAKTGVI